MAMSRAKEMAAQRAASKTASSKTKVPLKKSTIGPARVRSLASKAWDKASTKKEFLDTLKSSMMGSRLVYMRTKPR